MSEGGKDKKLTLSGSSKLKLNKAPDSIALRNNFQSQGKKSITVEVKRRGGGPSRPTEHKPLNEPGQRSGSLSDNEREARLKALQNAGNDDEKPERIRHKAQPKPAEPEIKTSKEVKQKPDFSNDAKPVKEKTEPKKVPKLRVNRPENRRNSGKITISQALSGGLDERTRSLASIKRQRDKAKKAEMGGVMVTQEKISREVVVPEAITVQEIANRMAERAADVVKALMKMGSMVTATQTIDADTAELIVEEFGHKVRRVTDADVENVLETDVEDAIADLKSRPPVVTVMGHVDHGKTSLLDALRKADVAGDEAGGITQHIGAYQVKLEGSDHAVTFLDTPGHAAFTQIRARGAKITDIVILVVAADDGIMEQTKEAINHAKAAEVPIIVAVNKIDKPEAQPEKVKNDLMSFELVPEEFGGDIMCIDVSAKQQLNLDKLIESILLQAEVLELKANPDRRAMGSVVEAKIDKGRGVVATLLVQHGTLKTGDIVVAGGAYGKARALIDYNGKNIKQAGPSVPVEILGLNEAPAAGDSFTVADSEKDAREVTEYRLQKEKDKLSAANAKSLDNLFGGGEESKKLNVIVKSDVQGSAEAIVTSLQKIENDEVEVKVIHSGVGAITESDVTLAKATEAIILAFNVRPVTGAKKSADADNIDIRYYSVIYDLVDDIKAALSGMLSPERRENFIGYAEIKEVFSITKIGRVAGCIVTEGTVKRGAGVRLLRENVVIHEGVLKTLKRFKDEVKEVKSGTECGMAFENYEDIRPGDLIEAFEVEEIARKIN